MELDLDLQIATDCPDLPETPLFERWACAALEGRRSRAALTIRVVGLDESADLNRSYRGVERPTNVLSFPFELPPGLDSVTAADDSIGDLIGDLVICAEVVRREAQEQGKALDAHWAHLVVHGVLHLLHYDHQSDTEATAMETLETEILVGLGFPPPYEVPLNP